MQKQQVPTAGLGDQPACLHPSLPVSLCPLSCNPQAGPLSCHAVSFLPPSGFCVHPTCPALTHTHLTFLATHPPGRGTRPGWQCTAVPSPHNSCQQCSLTLEFLDLVDLPTASQQALQGRKSGFTVLYPSLQGLDHSSKPYKSHWMDRRAPVLPSLDSRCYCQESVLCGSALVWHYFNRVLLSSV